LAASLRAFKASPTLTSSSTSGRTWAANNAPGGKLPIRAVIWTPSSRTNFALEFQAEKVQNGSTNSRPVCGEKAGNLRILKSRGRIL
jgi:hypothetical protein